MKTQCPHCSQVWNIETDEQGQTMKCFYCKAQFKAELYSGPLPKEPPAIPFQPAQSVEPFDKIGCPGAVWYVLGAIVGFFGIISGLFSFRQGGLAIIISAVMFWLICSAVGGVLNRLERIAHHTKKLREEIKTTNSR